MNEAAIPPALLPLDEYNLELRNNAHPPDWTNPEPKGKYDLIVVGGGTAGLVSAAIAAGLGARVALIEKNLLGGDCLNVGCVPSKAIIAAARRIRAIRNAAESGIRVGEYEIDFAAVMERMRRLRAAISPNDSAERFRQLGVDVYLGKGMFTAADRIVVAGTELCFKRAILATGTSPAAPPIPGLDQIDFLTNETLFSITELPPRLAVIGAGPIGCEMAQSFALFGSRVTLIEAVDRILPVEDADAAAYVHQAMVRDGVDIRCCGKVAQVQPHGSEIEIKVESPDDHYTVLADALLVAVGRKPNVEGMGLETAGVEYDKTGVKVDDRLRTTNPRIFAAGDVCSRYKFTHAADFMARIAVPNALLRARRRVSSLVIPWCTYTYPEIAHVGLHPSEAAEKGIAIDTYTQPLGEVDRAVLEGETDGVFKIHTRKGTDRIVGGTIVAANAGELIGELSLAMTHGLRLRHLSGTIHPYPTIAEAFRKVGDSYQRTRLKPLVRWLLRLWLRWAV